MASAGPRSGGTFATENNPAASGTTDWSSPGNAAAEDGSYANITMGGSASGDFLKATNFGFTIPTGATIDGIVLDVKKSNGATGGAKDKTIKLVKGGTFQGDDKADTATAWPSVGSFAYVSYGGASDKWGLTWAYTDINASDFGAGISAVRSGGTTPAECARIDHIRITVYYTESAGGAGKTQVRHQS